MPANSELRSSIEPCRPGDRDAILTIINDGASAYRGSIPQDCWHEPYMSSGELDRELASGVSFSGLRDSDGLLGVMGIQAVQGVDLIRHAYVRTACQGIGIGGRLIVHLLGSTRRPVLVGTWEAASWAIRFYERYGFSLVKGAARGALLDTFWTVPRRQREVSVVLSGPESLS